MEIELNGLTKYFGKACAVNNLDLTISDGEFMVVLGPSGCGKTTTLRMLAGFEEPTEGSIKIGDRVIADPKRKILVPPERRDIGMVFQSYAIWPHMTVFKNVAYPLSVRRRSKKVIANRVEEVLDMVGLGDAASRPATALSGGQMQRVALARALVSEPKVLLFDEPLSNLDVRLRERLRGELKEMQRRTGVTSVYVTHDQAEAVELGDRVTVMRGGEIVESGTPEQLWQAPRTAFVSDFIGTANLVRGTVLGATDDGHWRVSVDGENMVLATASEPVEAGQTVTLAIRPESFEVSSARKSTSNSWAARVLERTFQGASVRLTVAWGKNQVRAVSLFTYEPYAVGSLVYLSSPVQSVRVVSE